MLILGLGSNLGDRKAHLDKAIMLIADRVLDNIIRSGIYETDPLLPEAPGPGWHKLRYLNMAVGGTPKKKFSPEVLLDIIKNIETELGRKAADKWSPRVIDIDILAWDDMIFESPILNIPHIGLMERDFAYKPFADIDPEWVHPKTGKKICSCLE